MVKGVIGRHLPFVACVSFLFLGVRHTICVCLSRSQALLADISNFGLARFVLPELLGLAVRLVNLAGSERFKDVLRPVIVVAEMVAHRNHIVQ